MKIEELEKLIPMYAKAYYEGAEIISDEKFDALVDELREKKPESVILSTPGWGYVQTGKKARHGYQIVKSLDKVKTYAELPQRFKEVKGAYLSPKLDGISCMTYFKEGKLIQAITRGDGEEGKDITEKLRAIIGSEIKDISFTGGVRGELIISKANWEVIKEKYPEYINARNLCSGWMGSDDRSIEELKLIDYVVYKVIGQENTETPFTNKGDIIKWLANNFSKTIPHESLRDVDCLPNDGFDNYEDGSAGYMKKAFDDYSKMGFELDGVVISVPEVVYSSSGFYYIYDEIAYKFQAEIKEALVKQINWEMSRTQRYIPVVEIEPMFLSGATITNITGNNAKYLVDNGIGAGAKIEICRSGEVIPKHMDTLEMADPNLPTKCPHCGADLQWVGVDLKCVAEDCSNVTESDLKIWCETIGETDGFAWVLMKKYLDEFKVSSIDTLYEKKLEIIRYMELKKSVTDKKALDFFDKLFVESIDVEKALRALNIPRLGNSSSKAIGKNETLYNRLKNFAVYGVVAPSGDSTGAYDDTTANRNDLEDNLLQLLGQATTKSIMTSSKLSNLRYVGDRVAFKEQRSADEITYIAITGGLETMKRDAFVKYIEDFGYEMVSNLKKCKYLITNNPNSGSSKNKEAEKYGIELITEKDFLALLKGGN